MAVRHKFISVFVVSVLMMFLPLSAISFTDYTVSRGDTLWGIAVKHKPSGVSTSDMIKAIKGLNLSSSPAVVDNVVRLGDQLSLPDTKAEVDQAIAKLDQAQDNYQKIQRNGVHADNTTNTQTKTQLEASPTKVVSVQSMKQAPKTAAVASSQSEPTNTNNSVDSNNHAIISSVDHIQSQVTRTDQGYTLSVNQAPVKKDSQDSGGHIGSTVIWLIVIVIIILIIVRRLRKKKHVRNQNGNLDYQKRTPQAGSLEGGYQPKAELDASNISEVLVEAMLLLNDGRYDDARHTLQQTLKLKPDSIEIRMKLMEVYAASGDEISFNSERDYLAAHLMSHDDERWQEIDEVYHQYFIARG
ncbi:LysM peptidoglycan-binding domain-containing protein [bacterium SCSIO 12844]|nr:LysM peptidoglycan-binding domain-containing protein [bacterium SCSIO 12844]